MIRSIHLKSFGKFQLKTFALSDTTVFYGSNESGKTTIFDAIFKGLCKPARNKVQGRMLKVRYGDDDKAVVRMKGPEPDDLSEEEYLNLYAIRAGDLTVRIKENARWVKAIQSQLFSGGIDPELIIKRLENACSPRLNNPQQREIKDLEARLAECSQSLAEKTSQRDRILERQRSLEELAQTLESLSGQRQKLCEELERLEASLTHGEKQLTLASLKQQRARLRDFQGLRQELERMGNLNDGVLENARRAACELQEMEGELKLHQCRRKDLETDLLVLDEELSTLQLRWDEREPIYAEARRLREEAELLLAHPPMLNKIRWRITLLVLAAVIIVAGPTSLLWVDFHWVSAIISGSIFLSSIFVLFARYKIVERDHASESRRLGRLQDEWNLHAPDHSRVSVNSVSGLRDFLESLEKERSQIIDHKSQKLASKHLLEKRIAEQKRAILQLETKHQSQFMRLKSVLERHQALSVEALIERHGQSRQLKLELDRLAKTLGPLAESPEITLQRLDDEIRKLLEEGVQDALPDNETLEAQRRMIGVRRQQLDELSAQKASLRSKRDREQGEMLGQLEGLPGAILTLERDFDRLQKELDRKRLDQEAAYLACDLFRQVARGQEQRLGDLANDLGALLDKAMPDVGVQVQMEKLDDKRFRMTDASGEPRPIDQLSTGTRDFFLLAARLALAKKAARSRCCLALDEPFVAFDRARELAALHLLKSFQDETGWQMVFFTKDEVLRDRVGKIFGEPLIHCL